jgi:hypothetical protein
MEIKIKSHDDNDDDCRRVSYYTVVDGKTFYLSGCALPRAAYAREEIVSKVAELWPGAEIDWNGHTFWEN